MGCHGPPLYVTGASQYPKQGPRGNGMQVGVHVVPYSTAVQYSRTYSQVDTEQLAALGGAHFQSYLIKPSILQTACKE